MEITKTTDGNAAMLSLSGWLDEDGAPLLEQALGELGDSVAELVLDLEGLEYISSLGLRQLVLAQKKMMGRGTLTVIRPRQAVLDVLKQTGLYERLNVLA